MQTFLPYPDFRKTVKCLDNKRLGKQRVEAFQIEKSLKIPEYGWKHHPAVKMWKGYIDALREYQKHCILEWIKRGFKNNMEIPNVKGRIKYPFWLGDENFHSSHRSNLLRKDLNYYSKYNWKEENNLPYVWPV